MRKKKMSKRKLNKLIRQYSVELHDEYIASHSAHVSAGYMRDVLEEYIDKLDNLEKLTRPLFS
jgi:predicted DNA-binding protein